MWLPSRARTKDYAIRFRPFRARAIRGDRRLQILIGLTGIGVLVVTGVWLGARDGAASSVSIWSGWGVMLGEIGIVLGLMIWAAACIRPVRSQYFAVGMPGVLPAADEHPAVRTGRPHVLVPVRFSPPDGMGPAEVGMVLTGTVDTRHLAAVIVDLARRGYLVATPADGGWRLTVGMLTIDDLPEHEKTLLHGLFDGRSSVTTEDLTGRSQALLYDVEHALGSDAFKRGWLRCDPVFGSRTGMYTAIGLAALGVLGLQGHSAGGSGWACDEVFWFFPAVALAVMLHWPIGRTAVGTVMTQQAVGFRQYLATAEASQIRVEEEAGQIAGYLPYAIALGLADRWRSVIDGVAAGSGRPSPDAAAPPPAWVGLAHGFQGAVAGPTRPPVAVAR